MAAPSSPTPHPASSRVLRLGFLPLTSAAPLLVAQEQGMFARHGLKVELSREIGWATIRDKIVYGELDAAHTPAPMLWSAQLGLGCPACEVLTALVLNLNGNAITLSKALWDAGVRDGASLRTHARERRPKHPLTFGVVFPFSAPHLLLREWLRASGFDPDREVRIVVVPPAQMYRNLAAGTIDGYCAGEPWNSAAVRDGAGWCPTWGAVQQPGHLENVLMITRRFAESRAAEHAALVVALAEACAWCDEPDHREALVALLAEPRHLNLPPKVLAPALLGRFDCGHGRIENTPDFYLFHRHGANVPSAAGATALQGALVGAGLVPAEAATADLARILFREDLYRDALNPHRLHDPRLSA